MKRHLLEQARLSLLQLRVVTNERDEPLWPRRLSPRGLAMLTTGLLCIGLGTTYLGEGVRLPSLVFVDDLLPRPVYGSLWIVAGAASIVFGPTRWWHAGFGSTAVLHAAWAASGFVSWALAGVDSGFVAGLLYGHGAVLIIVITRMLNPPRPAVLADVVRGAHGE